MSSGIWWVGSKAVEGVSAAWKFAEGIGAIKAVADFGSKRFGLSGGVPVRPPLPSPRLEQLRDEAKAGDANLQSDIHKIEKVVITNRQAVTELATRVEALEAQNVALRKRITNLGVTTLVITTVASGCAAYMYWTYPRG